MDLDSITLLTLPTSCNNSSVAASEISCLVEKEYISNCDPEIWAAARFMPTLNSSVFIPIGGIPKGTSKWPRSFSTILTFDFSKDHTIWQLVRGGVQQLLAPSNCFIPAARPIQVRLVRLSIIILPISFHFIVSKIPSLILSTSLQHTCIILAVWRCWSVATCHSENKMDYD